MDATRYKQERTADVNASALATAPFNHTQKYKRDEQLAKDSIEFT